MLPKCGVGPDSINVAGGCYVTITCGVAYDDNGIVLFDTVDALKSTINPGIGTDCENVNGTLTPGTKGASKPTIKPSKRPVTKKAGKKR